MIIVISLLPSHGATIIIEAVLNLRIKYAYCTAHIPPPPTTSSPIYLGEELPLLVLTTVFPFFSLTGDDVPLSAFLLLPEDLKIAIICFLPSMIG